MDAWRLGATGEHTIQKATSIARRQGTDDDVSAFDSESTNYHRKESPLHAMSSDEGGLLLVKYQFCFHRYDLKHVAYRDGAAVLLAFVDHAFANRLDLICIHHDACSLSEKNALTGQILARLFQPRQVPVFLSLLLQIPDTLLTRLLVRGNGEGETQSLSLAVCALFVTSGEDAYILRRRKQMDK